MRREKKPYNERSDAEKISSQWTKLSGLHGRTEWSAAVVRAATAAELAVNLAVRSEFKARSELDDAFVDKMLKWANGLTGKLDRVLLPLLRGRNNYDTVEELCGLARRINDKRNDIVHRGVFCDKEEATELIEACRAFVQNLVSIYEPDFKLAKARATSKSQCRRKPGSRSR
jgi:hypothetical protein